MTEQDFKDAISPSVQQDYNAKSGNLGSIIQSITGAPLSPSQISDLNTWWKTNPDLILPGKNWVDLLKWIVLIVIEWIESWFD
jgi:hypothetical protein